SRRGGGRGGGSGSPRWGNPPPGGGPRGGGGKETPPRRPKKKCKGGRPLPPPASVEPWPACYDSPASANRRAEGFEEGSTRSRNLLRSVILCAAAAVLLWSVPASARKADEPRTPPRLPVADAGPDLSAAVGVPISIDGANSQGKSGVRPVRPRGDDLITFHWTILHAPPGSAALIDASSPAPVFTADVAGAYVLQLVMTNSNGLRSAPDEVTVTA